MKMFHSLFILSLVLIFILPTTSAQTTAQPPAPTGPTNISAILEKGGQFTTFLKLLSTSQEVDQINTALNNSNQGLTIFAPTDNAFTNLKPGTLNSLNDQQKVSLVQFHILPSFQSLSQFQTVSNPLRTQAGNSENGQFSLNVTTSGNQVNITTGVVDTTVANTLYTDGQLAVYQVDKVLLPLAMFGPPSPAPAPTKPEKAVKGSDHPSGVSDNSPTIDTSGGLRLKSGLDYYQGLIAALFGVVVASVCLQF